MTIDFHKHISAAILGLSLVALTAGGCGTLTGATLGGSGRCRLRRGDAFHRREKRSYRSRRRGRQARFTTSSAAAEDLTVTYYD
jgi:hypothetical protein